MTVPVVRQRAKAPKTRTGCRTCRARHIKCDEDRPACQRCLRSNRECPGYDPVVVPRTRGGATSNFAAVRPKSLLASSASSSNSTSTSTTVSRSSSSSPFLFRSPREVTVDLSAIEIQLFDFFRSQTVHQLPGNSWALSWERLAMHSASHEPAVSHAAIALSSLHSGLQDLALDQCNKAMYHARSRIQNLAAGEEASDSDVEVIAMVALLLFCFEVWRAQDYRAALHLRTGQSIMYERFCSRNGEKGDEKRMVKVPVTPKSNMDVLLQTFVRLGSDMLITRGSNVFLKAVVKEQIPTCFASLEEALIHLDSLSSLVEDAALGLRDAAAAYIDASPEIKQRIVHENSLPRFHDGTDDCLVSTYSRSVSLQDYPELEARLPAIKQDVCRWMSALAGVPVTPEQEAAHLLIQMQAFTLWFEVCTWREPDEMYVDSFEEQFEHILSQAERYVTLQGVNDSGASTAPLGSAAGINRPAFSLGTFLVPCIIVIAIKCRRSVVRRRCLEWMRRIDLKGIFDTEFIVAMTKKLIDIEESRARALLGLEEDVDLECHQVPLEARLLELDVATRSSEAEQTGPRIGGGLQAKAVPFREEEYYFYRRNTGRIVYACYGNDGDVEIREEDFPITRNNDKAVWKGLMASSPSMEDCLDPALLTSVSV